MERSKIKKMQAAVQRTSHPDAQWWPHAGLGLFMHWGIVSEFPKSEKLSRWTQDREDRGVFSQEEIGKQLKRLIQQIITRING